MSEFETFNRNLVGTHAQPQITVLRSGMLSLNKSAYASLGAPDAVELLYSREDRVIGMRSIPTVADTAHFVREQARGKGPFVVTAIAFIKHYALVMPRSLRWDAYLDNGVLCIRLDDDATAVTSNRAHSKPTVPPVTPISRAVSG